ncbi:MAG: class I SAM-dependent methyltransferase [Rhizobiaceae bacterium]
MADFRDTLMLPFHSGVLKPPQSGQDWRVLNADILPLPDDVDRQDLQCEQGSRPTFLALEGAGYRVRPNFADHADLDGCLVLASRSRALNERNMMRGWNDLKPGGILVFAGDKTSGVQPIRKWAGQLAEIGGSLSKNHAVVFWLPKQGNDWGQEVLQKPDAHYQREDFKIAPGMFSERGPDSGSLVLAEHFDQRIRGRVADFGAGWGYLSHRLLQQSQRIEQLELFEADWASLEAAKVNIAAPQVGVSYHWADLTQEAPRGPFDWVVMNPPFHSGRAALPELGQTFIEAAARCLPAGGRLLMVANTNLPYEKTLQTLFKKVERLDQANGFKVLEAVKGGGGGGSGSNRANRGGRRRR